MTCFEFERRRAAPGSPAEQGTWAHHLQRCPECRAQSRAHHLLEGSLGTIPARSATNDIAGAVIRRIRADGRMSIRPLRGIPRLSMSAYWLCALAVSVYIIQSLGWPFTPSAAFVWFAVLILAPLSFAAILWRGGLAHFVVRLFANSHWRFR
ncbi:MAG: hypothetical protein FJW35_13135 [Acidobacteria bacterium]|nr:hypothetical protein [Acidobacteriota bacterium]